MKYQGFVKKIYFLCENCRWKKLKFQETVNFIPILTSNTTLNLVYDNINNILLQKIDDPKRDASKQNSSSALQTWIGRVLLKEFAE